MKHILLAFVLFSVITNTSAATYFVDNSNPKATDTNPGTEAAPWKSISRSAGAKELQPGDTVLIKSGVRGCCRWNSTCAERGSSC